MNAEKYNREVVALRKDFKAYKKAIQDSTIDFEQRSEMREVIYLRQAVLAACPKVFVRALWVSPKRKAMMGLVQEGMLLKIYALFYTLEEWRAEVEKNAILKAVEWHCVKEDHGFLKPYKIEDKVTRFVKNGEGIKVCSVDFDNEFEVLTAKSADGLIPLKTVDRMNLVFPFTRKSLPPELRHYLDEVNFTF